MALLVIISLMTNLKGKLSIVENRKSLYIIYP